MPRFIVHTMKTEHLYYEVEADSPEQAEEIWAGDVSLQPFDWQADADEEVLDVEECENEE